MNRQELSALVEQHIFGDAEATSGCCHPYAEEENLYWTWKVIDRCYDHEGSVWSLEQQKDGFWYANFGVGTCHNQPFEVAICVAALMNCGVLKQETFVLDDKS